MEINEKLLRQIIEDVLSEMKGSDKPVSFTAPAASAAPQATPPAGDGPVLRIEGLGGVLRTRAVQGLTAAGVKLIKYNNRYFDRA